MKRVLKGFLCAALALSLFGCGDNTNVSTKAAKDEDYSDIFTDKEKKSGVYKNSFIAYNFSLENMGTTKVYVDTSEGHKFELVADEGGFNIVDKKGEVVVYARAINDNAYEDLTGRADLDETINGRDFKCLMTDNGKIDAFTNLADVGIDIGFAMEAPSGNPSDFSLVAFRGEPVKSSKKKETKKEEEKTEKTTESKKGSLTNSTLSKDVQEKLDSLDTDYAKVNWGVQYSFGEDYPGLVVSVTPAYNGISHYLIVALTNLYDSPMRVTGTAQAKNKADKVVGDTFIYASAIGSGSTVISIISCDDLPDGRIHWEDVEIEKGSATYTPWEADYSAKTDKDSGCVKVDYEIYSSKKEDMENADLTVLLLDKDGFVLGYGSDYLSDTIKAGSKGKGTVSIYGDMAVLSQAKDAALFSNPIKF